MLIGEKEYCVSEGRWCVGLYQIGPVHTLRDALRLAESRYRSNKTDTVIIEKTWAEDGSEHNCIMTYDEARQRSYQVYDDPDIVVLDDSLMSDTPYTN